MKLVTLSAIAALSASSAFGAGSHDHSHGGMEEGHMMEMMAIGMPGMMGKEDRTIEVTMRETDDGGMIFEPMQFDIKQGETIRFHVTNNGELEHEFVIDTLVGNAKHKELMAKMEMEHDDPNSVRLDAGESGEVIWTFANAGTFEFACLIPGHYESGMHGPIEVAETMTERTYTKGVVKKIKASSGKVTIIHEELVDLDMPAMTMVFRVADNAMLDALSEGQEIEFIAKRVKGKLTVTDLK
ncbi:plastocyanin [Roseovarius litorisediminis]|uniref:Plastocyanin n=1 Tax=Roseovarius litorisediminis TaxID=1312363 RepID=A0A1Y5RBW4_9RHOB|nr:copper-binding protein [Roseovarius litorisediminis]SLN11290.1 plastocyanin [Roseovarius litorisediminis]